jgi:ferritin-like metal-binding protein YciE
MITNETPLSSKLEEFFLTLLKQMYWAEIHLVNVLNTMHESATSQALKDAYEQHKNETVEHSHMLEEIFTQLNQPVQHEPSAGLQGLFDEGWQVIDETDTGSAQRDVALIIAAQKVEHYEMACYGSMVTLAHTMGKPAIAGLLVSILNDEKRTDVLLTRIAEENINEKANQEPVNEDFNEEVVSSGYFIET